MTVHTVRGAWRDLNAKGRGTETFRQVWRNGQWQWISSRLPFGTFLASDRHAATVGDVETGEYLVQFSRNGTRGPCSVDRYYVVVDQDKPLLPAECHKPRLGVCVLTHPLTKETIEVTPPPVHG